MPLSPLHTSLCLCPPWNRSKRKGERRVVGPCSEFTQPLSSVPEASPELGTSHCHCCGPSFYKYLPGTYVPWGGGWEESEAPDLEELTEWWSEPLVRAPRGHSWGRNAGKVWGPGPEMFRLFQNEKGSLKKEQTRHPVSSQPSVDLGGI